MSAFFSSIRNYFKSEYHGRYLSIILREIARHEPRSVSLIIDQISSTSTLPFWRQVSKEISTGEFTVKCEYPFKGQTKTRRADLAVLHGEQPIVLIEVKEFDHLAPQNPEQLSDYLSLVSRHVGFVHLHRFLPSPKERAKIKKKAEAGWPVAMLSYDQIYKAVANAAKEQRALGALLCDYLEDIGVGIYRPVSSDDRKALAFLSHSVVAYDHARHAALGDVITLDFMNVALEPGARAGVELTLQSAKELRAALDRAIGAAEFDEAEVRGKGALSAITTRRLEAELCAEPHDALGAG
jgi:hypothetical protein